jgi:lysophospholipase L1-like esterase
MGTRITNPNISLKVEGYLYALLLGILLLTWPISASGANILAFGDSITAGDRSTVGGYPHILGWMLNNGGRPSLVINKGISGEDTPAGAKRFASVLASFPADLVLIMEGTNDILHGIGVEETRQNLQKMIDISRARGVTPILSTLTPSNRAISEALILHVWNPMISSLARRNRVKLIDPYTTMLTNWSASNVDGLHPNDFGYITIATTWYSTIRPLISSSGRVRPDPNGSGGFIATAAFDTSIEKHVKLLGEFRDSYLLTIYPGQQLVEGYYRQSPSVADFIDQHKGLKLAVQILLYPIIVFCFLLLKLSLTMKFTLAALIAAVLILFGFLL